MTILLAIARVQVAVWGYIAGISPDAAAKTDSMISTVKLKPRLRWMLGTVVLVGAGCTVPNTIDCAFTLQPVEAGQHTLPFGQGLSPEQWFADFDMGNELPFPLEFMHVYAYWADSDDDVPRELGYVYGVSPAALTDAVNAAAGMELFAAYRLTAERGGYDELFRVPDNYSEPVTVSSIADIPLVFDSLPNEDDYRSEVIVLRPAITFFPSPDVEGDVMTFPFRLDPFDPSGEGSYRVHVERKTYLPRRPIRTAAVEDISEKPQALRFLQCGYGS